MKRYAGDSVATGSVCMVGHIESEAAGNRDILVLQVLGWAPD